MPKPPKAELAIELFTSAPDFETWLKKNGANSDGLWLRLAKKASPLESVSYIEALEVALCYGWIDGLKKSYDEDSWLQKFTPRRAKSIWSKINRDRVQELIESGRMQAAGLSEVERAKADGRWDAAYDSMSNAEIPDDLAIAFESNPKAAAFFATLTGSNRYAVLYRIQTAKKAETRAKRVKQFVEMLDWEEKIHS